MDFSFLKTHIFDSFLLSHKYSCRIKGKVSSLCLHSSIVLTRGEKESNFLKWSNKSYFCDLDLCLYFSLLLFSFTFQWSSMSSATSSTNRRNFAMLGICKGKFLCCTWCRSSFIVCLLYK